MFRPLAKHGPIMRQKKPRACLARHGEQSETKSLVCRRTAANATQEKQLLNSWICRSLLTSFHPLAPCTKNSCGSGHFCNGAARRRVIRPLTRSLESTSIRRVRVTPHLPKMISNGSLTAKHMNEGSTQSHGKNPSGSPQSTHQLQTRWIGARSSTQMLSVPFALGICGSRMLSLSRQESVVEHELRLIGILERIGAFQGSKCILLTAHI